MTDNISIKELENVAGGKTGWTCRTNEYSCAISVKCYSQPDFGSCIDEIPFNKCLTILEERSTTYNMWYFVEDENGRRFWIPENSIIING